MRTGTSYSRAQRAVRKVVRTEMHELLAQLKRLTKLYASVGGTVGGTRKRRARRKPRKSKRPQLSVTQKLAKPLPVDRSRRFVASSTKPRRKRGGKGGKPARSQAN